MGHKTMQGFTGVQTGLRLMVMLIWLCRYNGYVMLIIILQWLCCHNGYLNLFRLIDCEKY